MAETLRLAPLDIHFADFIVRIDRHPCDELWWGAALASHATGRGHSCFTLYDLPEAAALAPLQSLRNPPPSDADSWRCALEQCDTVGAPGGYTPLVLDRAGRLYLHRCWSYEQQVASAILSRIRPVSAHEQGLDDALGRYFPPQGEGVDLQRTAARMALTHRFSVISGGPGSGKTATAARILALLLGMGGDSRPKITLAAPTGKAALRLHQSIVQAAGRLALPGDLAHGLPSDVSTIHRLLGVRSRGGFRHNRDNRLPCDILLVDEASMVDLQLMSHLLEALRDDARVILLGDRHQLASVEAGAVLADICDSEDRASVPVTQLTKSYRFGDNSGIAALGRLINSGDSAGAMALLDSGQYPDILWRQLPAGRALEGALAAAVRDGYAEYVQAASPGEALARLNSFRVLSPLRGGPTGVENLNRLCQTALDPEHAHDDRGTFMKPFMITGNNYELGLYNGDTGVVTESDDGQTVWFENPDGGLRHISMLRLPPGDAAFALTVHKSQGSEFGRVLLILPDQPSDVLSRELLYTAVTRARSRIEIWGTEEVFRQAIERRTVRKSGLQDALSGGVP